MLEPMCSKLVFARAFSGLYSSLPSRGILTRGHTEGVDRVKVIPVPSQINNHTLAIVRYSFCEILATLSLVTYE